jgi:preprotein translocase subunit SecA
VSGEWTIDNQADGLKERIQLMVKAALEADAELKKSKIESTAAAPESPVLEGEDPIYADIQDLDDPDEQPMWRQLRHEIWQQFGTWTDLDEDLFNSGEEKLADELCQTIAHSLIRQRERLFDLCDQLIGQQINVHCPPGTHEDEWDFEALNIAMGNIFGCEFGLTLDGQDQNDLANQSWGIAEKRVSERVEELDRLLLLYFIRHFSLEEIDQRWIEHLTTMDHLRQGIGLRGYGQKDPKKEYKKEGFDLFSEMMEIIQANSCRKIFHVQIEREDKSIPELQANKRTMRESHAEAQPSLGGNGEGAFGDASDGGKTAAEKQKTVRRDKPKVGRNDPCPCGSGKKYKKCHGREGQAQL